MSARLLVFTAGFGEGHNAAARALAQAANERDGENAARVVDVFAVARPRLNAVVRRSYLGLINRAPYVWRSAYAWLDRSPQSTRFFGWMRREMDRLAGIIAAERPAVLCSTYPLYAYMLERLAKKRGLTMPAHYNVVTDSISINSLWWRADCAGWFVPNRDSAEVLLGAGIRAEAIHSLGFPVATFFADHARELAPPELRPGVRPRVLYIINSGTRGAAETAVQLLQEDAWDVTCTVGRDDALRHRLLELSAHRATPARILGWTNEIPRLLMTHHVVVSKAGGATTQEAIAARCPMIVSQIVPGQEEGNYELLRRHGIGGHAPTPPAVLDGLRFAFANQAREWRRWRLALDGLAQPDAARAIIARMLPPDRTGFSPLKPASAAFKS